MGSSADVLVPKVELHVVGDLALPIGLEDGLWEEPIPRRRLRHEFTVFLAILVIVGVVIALIATGFMIQTIRTDSLDSGAPLKVRKWGSLHCPPNHSRQRSALSSWYPLMDSKQSIGATRG